MNAAAQGQTDGKKSEGAVKAIVAPGRTLSFPGEQCGPGAEVRLPQEEVVRLRALGYLVDPAAKPLPVGNGPTFGTTEGPNVKVA